MSLVVVEGVSNASAQTSAAAPVAVTERNATTFSDNSAPNLSPEQAPMSSSEIIGSSSSASSSASNEAPATSITGTTLAVPNAISALSNTSTAILPNMAVIHQASVENDNVSQGQKLLTAVSFPTAPKVLNNGQRANAVGPKVKIIQNVVLQSNISGSKTGIQKYVTQNSYSPTRGQTTIAGNGAKLQVPKHVQAKTAPNIKSPGVNHYPSHKTHIKHLTPVTSYVQKTGGIKTIPAQQKPATVTPLPMRTGIKTLPPQRPPPNHKPTKPNYIGKHTPASFKTKNYPGVNKNATHKVQKRPMNSTSLNNRYPASRITQNPQISVNQAITAQILQTLDDGSSNRNAYVEPQQTPVVQRYQQQQQQQQHDVHTYPSKMDSNPERKASLLDLSMICRYILMDHNYVATPPSVSPRQPPPQPIQHHNGVGTNSLSTASASYTTLTPNSLIGSSSGSTMLQEDDAASDISSGGERKPETEGEETETAPEAENDLEVYEGSVTRCICDYTHDDGYMLQCDKCKVWQHVKCIFKEAAEANLPDNYFCEICDPTLVTDKHKARLVQQAWLKADKARREQVLREAKLLERKNDPMSDSSSSDGEHHNNNVIPKRRGPTSGGRRKSEPINRRPNLNSINNRRQRRESARDNMRRTPVKRKERKITKRKAKARASVDDEEESQDVWPPPSAVAQLPQLRQWIEKYEEAVTNHYSPELRARMSNMRLNGAHESFSASQAEVFTAHRCRVYTQPLTGIKSVKSNKSLPPSTPVIELRGKYMLSTQHRNPTHTGMLLTRQHSQKPGPFLFFYRLARDSTTCLEVCVDTRTYGNDARFIRRSCKPNAELKPCMEKGVLHLYVVTTQAVEENAEITIKHESHDLASVGTTSIACACGLRNEECGVNNKIVPTSSTTTASNNNASKKAPAANTNTTANGDVTESHRKRRGRRTVSSSEPERELMSPTSVPETASPTMPEVSTPTTPQKQQPQQPPQQQQQPAPLPASQISTPTQPPSAPQSAPTPPVAPPPTTNTRRSSQHNRLPPEPETTKETSNPSKEKETSERETVSSGKRNSNADNKKLSREEKKMQAYIKAFEKMEKLEQRRQENQARQTQRRESEPGTRGHHRGSGVERDDDDSGSKPVAKRRKRKGRARTVSTSQSSSGKRRLRVNSTDSYATSGDENGVLSPKSGSEHPGMTTPVKNGNAVNASNLERMAISRGVSDLSSPCRSAVGVLLSLANGDAQNEMHKSPSRESDSNSSPETPLSSACLLVAAAVEPLEPGFKFPKTKKAIMNEWLNKSPADIVQSASSISPSSLTPHLVSNDTNSSSSINSNSYSADSGYYGNKNNLGLGTLAQAASFCDSPPQVTGSAKKRWLRQAISEECDSPNSRPETPPSSEMAAPPKKRRLPRESLSSEQSFTPPTTPTNVTPPSNNANITLAESLNFQDHSLDSGSESQDMTGTRSFKSSTESRVEIIFSSGNEQEDESPNHNQLLESDSVLKERAAEMQMEFGGLSSQILDPRLMRYNNSENLVGTVEKTLRVFEENLGGSSTTSTAITSVIGVNKKSGSTPPSELLSSPVTSEPKKKEAAAIPTAAKRKLSISEYRQRKKLNTSDKSARNSTTSGNEDNGTINSEPNSPLPNSRRRSNSASSSTSSLSSDEDDELKSLMATREIACSIVPDLTQPEKVVGFSSAPTELELQRENVSLRLKQALGISITEKTSPALKSMGLVDSLLNNQNRELPTSTVSSQLLKSSIAHQPTLYPPPPSTPPPPPPPPASPQPKISISIKEELNTNQTTPITSEEQTKEELCDIEKNLQKICDQEESEENKENLSVVDEPKPAQMFYSPDRDDVHEEGHSEEGQEGMSTEEEDGHSFSETYVPPFNNPLYPNSTQCGFVGSVIDNEPYEGRNPSPPPKPSTDL